VPFNASVRGSFGPQSKIGESGLFLSASAGAPLSYLNIGVQGFSPNFFGVSTEDSYIIPNNARMESVTFKKQQSGFYHFWFLVVTKSGTTTANNTYTFKYGALLPVPSGGSAGDIVTVNLSSALSSFGSSTIPATGTHHIAWQSGSGQFPGATNPTGSMWWLENATSMGSYDSRGGISWRYWNDGYPTLNGTITTGIDYNGSGGSNYMSSGISIKVNYQLLSAGITLNGSSPARAAVSARAIKQLTGTTTNGYYWIKPTSFDVPRYIYCDMNTNGGGWMLIGWHGGQQTGANSHVANNEWNSTFTLGSGVYSNATLTSVVAKNNDSYGVGYKFIKSLVTENRSSGVFSATWWNDGGNNSRTYYYNTDGNADWDRYDVRAAQSPSWSSSDARNNWLRTGYTSYTTSGRNGGGSGSGSTIAYEGASWGVHPFNMNNPSSEGNHGIAITGYYASAPANNPDYVRTYYGGHHDSLGTWGRPISLWLKV